MILGGLAGFAVDGLATPVTLRRYGAGQYVEGEWTQGGPTLSTIRAVVQAPSAQDLLTLPEGERTEAHVTVWTRVELRTASEDGRTLADEITASDRTYKVRAIARRDEAGFTRAIARLITNDRGRSI